MPYQPITTRLPWSLGAVDGTPESKKGQHHQEGGGPHQEQQVDEGRDRRQPQRHRDHDDHPPRITPRRKEDGDDDNYDRHGRGNRKATSHPNWGGTELRQGHDRDRDRSPRRGHADGYYREGGHRRAGPVGGEVHLGPFSQGPDCFAFPKPSAEELKATVDRTLQDLFSSYADQLRKALHRVFASETEVPEPSCQQVVSFQEAREE